MSSFSAAAATHRAILFFSFMTVQGYHQWTRQETGIVDPIALPGYTES